MSWRPLAWAAALAAASAACEPREGGGLGIGVPAAQPLAAAAQKRPILVQHLQLLPPEEDGTAAGGVVLQLGWPAAEGQPPWGEHTLHSQSGEILPLAEEALAAGALGEQQGVATLQLSSAAARQLAQRLGAYQRSASGATDVLLVADPFLRIQGYLAWGAGPPEQAAGPFVAAALVDGTIAQPADSFLSLPGAGTGALALPVDLQPAP